MAVSEKDKRDNLSGNYIFHGDKKLNLSIHLKENELKSLKDTQEVANLKFQKGIIPEIDLLKIRSEIFEIEIEIDTLKNQVDKEIRKFYYLCLGKLNQSLEPEAENFESDDSYQKKIAFLKKRIARIDLFRNTPEVNIKKIEIEEAKRKIEEAKALNTPIIIPFLNLKDNDIRDREIGLMLKFPIYQKGIKEEEITLAQTRLTQIERELEELTFESQINIATTLNNIQDKERRIEAQKRKIEIVEQIYEISRVKHERGLISAKDLLDNHKEMFNQQKEFLQLQIDLYLEYINLLNLTYQLNDAYQEDIL